MGSVAKRHAKVYARHHFEPLSNWITSLQYLRSLALVKTNLLMHVGITKNRVKLSK